MGVLLTEARDAPVKLPFMLNTKKKAKKKRGWGVRLIVKPSSKFGNMKQHQLQKKKKTATLKHIDN